MIDEKALAAAVLQRMRRAALSGLPGDRFKAEEILHEVFEAARRDFERLFDYSLIGSPCIFSRVGSAEISWIC